MTVKEATATIKAGAKSFAIVWEGTCYKYDPESELHAAAFGDFIVKEIVISNNIELTIAAEPKRKSLDR